MKLNLNVFEWLDGWFIPVLFTAALLIMVFIALGNSVERERLQRLFNMNAAQQFVADCTAKHTPERCFAMRELGIAP